MDCVISDHVIMGHFYKEIIGHFPIVLCKKIHGKIVMTVYIRLCYNKHVIKRLNCMYDSQLHTLHMIALTILQEPKIRN